MYVEDEIVKCVLLFLVSSLKSFGLNIFKLFLLLIDSKVC